MSEMADAALNFPARVARWVGVLWLACIVVGMVGFMAGMPLIVSTDSAATAQNIISNESLFRLSAVANLFSGATYLGVTALLYYLLRPVSGARSLGALCFGIVGVALGAGFPFVMLGAATVLGAPQYQSLHTTGLQESVLLALNVAEQFFLIAMIFFGIQIAIVGSLIAGSTFLPKALGILLMIGGSTYVATSTISLFDPAVGSGLFPIAMGMAFLGEGALTLWLLIRGVDQHRWMEQGRRAPDFSKFLHA